jgi:hypothetical protein
MCLRCAELYAVTRLRGEALITGPQIRAARGFLAWDRRDLAKKAVVTIYTVERIETGAEISGTAMVKGLAAIKGALEAEGRNRWLLWSRHQGFSPSLSDMGWSYSGRLRRRSDLGRPTRRGGCDARKQGRTSIRHLNLDRPEIRLLVQGSTVHPRSATFDGQPRHQH